MRFLISAGIMITWKDVVYFSVDTATKRIKRALGILNLNSLEIHESDAMISACGALLAYIEETNRL